MFSSSDLKKNGLGHGEIQVGNSNTVHTVLIKISDFSSMIHIQSGILSE